MLDTTNTATQSFRVKVGRYTYFVRFIPEFNVYNRIDMYRMDVGGLKSGCVTLKFPVVDKDDPYHKREATLVAVKYSPLCAVTNTLEQGFGTRHMLKTALNIVALPTFPIKLNRIKFYDTSTKTCDDGTVLDLAKLMIAFYGKTYYEKYFHATLGIDIARKQYQHLLQVLKTKPIISFHEFARTNKIPTKYSSMLEPLFNNSSSYHAFFQTIRDKYPDTFCNIVNGWLDVFVDNILENNSFLESVWYIDVDSIPRIDVKHWTVDENNNDEVYEMEQIASETIYKVQKEMTGGLIFRAEDMIPEKYKV